MSDLAANRLAALKNIGGTQVVLFAAGALAAVAAACVLVLPEGIRQPVLIATCGILCAAPIAFRAAQGRFDPFEPILILSVAAFVMFFMRPAWMWANDDWIFGIYDARDGFTGAATIAALGIGALLAGYSMPWGRRLAKRIPPIQDDWDPGRVVTACIVLLVIGAFLFTFYIGVSGGALTTYFSGRSAFDDTLRLTAGGQRATTGYFAFAPYVVIPVALVLLEVWRRRRTPAIAALALGSIALALLMTVPRGDRTFILAFALPLVAVPYLIRGRRPRVISIIVALLAAMLIANVLLNYRKQNVRQDSLVGAIGEAVANPLETIDEFMLGVDTTNINTLAATYDAMPARIDFKVGQELTSIVALPIPGLLWPSKPETPGQHVYAELFPQRVRAGVASSMYGGFYADSWFIGVIGYSFLWGMLARALFEYWRTNPGNRSIAILYAAMLPMLIIMFRNSPKLMIGGLPFLILPIVTAFWWGSRSRSHIGSKAALQRA